MQNQSDCGRPRKQAVPHPRSAMSYVAAITLIATLVLSQPADAVDTLSAAELGALCATENAEPDMTHSSCRTYILGFLEGAIATDPRVAMKVTEQLEAEDSFHARAYRTRLGRDLQRLGPSHLAGFCVPREAPLVAVTTHVIDSLPTTPAEEPARELVYRVLRENYPCHSSKR